MDKLELILRDSKMRRRIKTKEYRGVNAFRGASPKAHSIVIKQSFSLLTYEHMGVSLIKILS